MSNEIAILGVGMHPWGKWGKNFVEYGVKAARDAIADSGVHWKDVQFVFGAATMRCGYPGYVAGATFAQALGWRLNRDALQRSPRMRFVHSSSPMTPEK